MIFLFTLLLALFSFSISAAESYTVDTKSKLNMRSGPGTSYSVVEQMSPGDAVELIDDNNSGKWVKVNYRGKQGYVMKKYLKPGGEEPQTTDGKKWRLGHDPNNEWLLWVIVGLFVAVILVNCFDTENRFIVGFVYLALPAAIILYTRVTPAAMWFCDPDVVGWGYTILNVFLLIIALSFLGLSFFSLVVDLFCDFSLMLLLISLLFGAAIFFIVITAIQELLIVALLMLFGAGSGGYVGTFIDSDGNVFDIFRR